MPGNRRSSTDTHRTSARRAAALAAVAIVSLVALHASAWGTPTAGTTGAVITSVAGEGTAGFAGDGGPATKAQLNGPGSVAVDGTGNVVIADTANHRIRRLDATTGVLTTVAGSGIAGYSGDSGPAPKAQLNSPAGVAVDATGNVVIADTANHRIRRLDATTGVVTTISGTGVAGYSGDGGAPAKAQLNSPAGVAIDDAGQVVIADTANHRIRRVDAATGVLSTISGTGVAGYSGDGGPATKGQLSSPAGVAVDATGNVVIADTANHRIRRVAATHRGLTTLLGENELEPTEAALPADPSTEGAVPPTDVRPQGQRGVAVDPAGTVFVANSARNRIDRIDQAEGAGEPVVPAASPGGAASGVAPDSAPGNEAAAPPASGGSVCDLVGTAAVAGTVSVNSTVATPGEELALQGDGFDAGDQLTVTLCSTPRPLGSITADPAGRYQAKIRIPSDVALGAHHLVVSDGRGNAAVPLTLAQRSGRGATGAEPDPNDPGTGLYDDLTDQVDPENAAADAAIADELAALEDEADAFLDSTEDTSGIPTTGSDIELLLKLATLSLVSGLVLVSRSRKSTNS